VCFGCKEPFSSSTFYVLDDRPYCENDYHRLNGSLCNHCGVGIEGQYLEDETARKHHVGCFRCGDCGTVLKDGYFEVAGKAYCEKDAWRRVQQPWMGTGGPGGRRGPGPSSLNPGLPGGPRMGGKPYGLPSPGAGNRLAPPRPKMEKRMTRLGMMWGCLADAHPDDHFLGSWWRIFLSLSITRKGVDVFLVFFVLSSGRAHSIYPLSSYASATFWSGIFLEEEEEVEEEEEEEEVERNPCRD
jgi:hypothetical protein